MPGIQHELQLMSAAVPSELKKLANAVAVAVAHKLQLLAAAVTAAVPRELQLLAAAATVSFAFFVRHRLLDSVQIANAAVSECCRKPHFDECTQGDDFKANVVEAEQIAATPILQSKVRADRVVDGMVPMELFKEPAEKAAAPLLVSCQLEVRGKAELSLTIGFEERHEEENHAEEEAQRRNEAAEKAAAEKSLAEKKAAKRKAAAETVAAEKAAAEKAAAEAAAAEAAATEAAAAAAVAAEAAEAEAEAVEAAAAVAAEAALRRSAQSI